MTFHSPSPAAATARETARAADGKFGTQPRTEASFDLEDGTGSALPAADVSSYADSLRSIELLREALEERSLAHMEDTAVLLARAVREAHPEITTLELDREGEEVVDVLAFDADENEVDISELKESFENTSVGILYDDLLAGIRQGDTRRSTLINDHDEIDVETVAERLTGPEVESAAAGRNVPSAVRDATLRRTQADVERSQKLLELAEADRSRAAASVLMADWAEAGVAQAEIHFGGSGAACSVRTTNSNGSHVNEQEIRHNPTVADPLGALRADSALEVLPVGHLHEGAAGQRRARIDLPAVR